MYQQDFNPVSDSLGLTAIFAALPLVCLFVLLFGALQVTAANDAGLSQTLMAAANSSGGVLSKMVSPQNLAIGAAAVGLAGQEGDLFRKVIGWSLVLILAMCLLVYLQSTSVLGWMVA